MTRFHRNEPLSPPWRSPRDVGGDPTADAPVERDERGAALLAELELVWDPDVDGVPLALEFDPHGGR